MPGGVAEYRKDDDQADAEQRPAVRRGQQQGAIGEPSTRKPDNAGNRT